MNYQKILSKTLDIGDFILYLWGNKTESKMGLILIVFLIVYVLSAFYMHWFMRTAHSRGGRWEGVSPDEVDVFLTVMPIINFMTAISLAISYSPKMKNEHYTDKSFPRRFFGIKY